MRSSTNSDFPDGRLITKVCHCFHTLCIDNYATDIIQLQLLSFETLITKPCRISTRPTCTGMLRGSRPRIHFAATTAAPNWRILDSDVPGVFVESRGAPRAPGGARHPRSSGTCQSKYQRDINAMAAGDPMPADCYGAGVGRRRGACLHRSGGDERLSY